MMFRLLKHATIGEEYHFSGTTIRMSVFDKILDDGRLIYHYGKEKYQVVPADLFKIVYDSHAEMERETKK